MDLSTYPPACLPKVIKDYTGTDGFVYGGYLIPFVRLFIQAGWGVEKQGGVQSPVLKKVAVPIVSNEACGMAKGKVDIAVDGIDNAVVTGEVSYEGKITGEMLCAGATGKDACQVLPPLCIIQ